jgi:ankyrin repeat protein
MSEFELIAAVKNGNAVGVKALLESGADVNQQDEQGWTALNWAAGKGDVESVKLLLQHGADVLRTGRDLRTASMIALAAGQVKSAELLLKAESQTDKSPGPARKYCAAYPLKQFRQFPGWTLSDAQEGSVAFLHQNYVVTQSIWDDEDVVFDQVTEDWKIFCDRVLEFRVPDDLELITDRQLVAASSKSVKAEIS